MAKISKELNSILNENKDPVEENKSPLIFILLLIITVLAVYFAVMYFNIKDEKNDISKDEKYKKIIQENIILNEDKKRIQKELDNIKIQKSQAKTIKNDLTSKDKEEIIKLKKQIEELKKEVKSKNKYTQDSNNKIDFKKLYFNDNSKVFKCYNYAAGSVSLPKECLNGINKFLKKNTEALRYQLIPVLSSNDKKTFNNFDENTQELLLNGVSTKRVAETLWEMKKILGNDIILTSNSYYVKSKQGNSGFILKAYY